MDRTMVWQGGPEARFRSLAAPLVARLAHAPRLDSRLGKGIQYPSKVPISIGELEAGAGAGAEHEITRARAISGALSPNPKNGNAVSA